MRTFLTHVARFKSVILLLGVVLCLSLFLHDVIWVLVAGATLTAGGYALMLVVHPGRLTPDRFAGRPLGTEASDGEGPREDGAPRAIASPVEGRWIVVNGPADKVPSHGIDAYGQTYAVDLVHHPEEDRDWSALHAWPLARPAASFPAFGRPVHAPADGVVVRASGRHRDHWSRNSWPALLFLFVEGSVRELGGPGFLFGNHLIIDLGDGTYAAFAHLRRGSLRVKPGDRVRAGDHIADVGNSGNSSEPHLHFHLMDHQRALIAGGVPFVLDRYEIDGEERRGVPHNNRPFTATRHGGGARPAVTGAGDRERF
ncbi:M23 family metallopeptidase [Spirillospora sp. NPDC047279]|uniref:M23 family metallopeptidase n=1 Tax=Spirillospora sp. NPDC047279 TaxID=3155478 RepID=UPI0033C45FB5